MLSCALLGQCDCCAEGPSGPPQTTVVHRSHLTARRRTHLPEAMVCSVQGHPRHSQDSGKKGVPLRGPAAPLCDSPHSLADFSLQRVLLRSAPGPYLSACFPVTPSTQPSRSCQVYLPKTQI